MRGKELLGLHEELNGWFALWPTHWKGIRFMENGNTRYLVSAAELGRSQPVDLVITQ
ncbi:hypothetical protein BJY01DRAFT_215593 [Aspergillus pseudoustus]|uniref:Uncharacterized protein n=1 Tax=Aspergillus pseudoustus TaxID=1810923 RepID=A0ABR4JUG9_9EURO